MPDYLSYEAADFAMDEDFIRWVQQPLPADTSYWDEFLTRYPSRMPAIEQAREIVRTIQIPQYPITDELIRKEIGKLLHTISSNPNTRHTTTHTRPRKIYQILIGTGIAAMICGLLLLSPRLMSPTTEPATPFDYAIQTVSKRLIEKVNNKEKTDSILFADGTEIWLSPNSRISYSIGFDTAAIREVYLSGEAFFKVTKSPLRPFRVISGEVITRVLGTSFCVRSFDKDTTIQVIVRSGKVSVSTPTVTTSSPLMLTCNQRLVYKRSIQKFQRSLLEQPAIITTGETDENMVYEDTPLEQVFKQLSHAYGIGIVYDNELLKKCTVTADLKGESFYHKLDLICRAIGASYEVIDGLVVIQSAGC